jgi:dinuclear metal center YbgI/SA1388 family protein
MQERRATPLDSLVAWLDEVTSTRETPDYSGALNGLQFANMGHVHHIAAAVDASNRVIDATIAIGADMLIVHHGLFWGGAQPIAGALYRKYIKLIDHDIAIYSCHLPLDRHAVFGNNALLAKELGLTPTATWLPYKGVDIGTLVDTEVSTRELVERAARFSAMHGHTGVATPYNADRVSRRIAVCSGGGASSESLNEALSLGADTLVVGEGPHHTAIKADDTGLVVIYAGHYATETLGVQALAKAAASEWQLPWDFLPAPTGL